MEYNVLIAEDDESIVELLTLYLNSNGFNVISANDGEAAMELLRHRKTDIVLVDIMMSKMNGYELIKAIRQENNLPIIIISAKNEASDKILGLNLGADAYITKPFNPLEVIAYVRAMLRRYYEYGGSPGKQENALILKVGELTLDTEAFALHKNGRLLSMTSAELKILAKLMRSPKRVFTKEQLCECINGRYYENDDRTMMVHISNIRAKIEDDPANPKYIKTVRGLGYKMDSDD